MTRVKICGITNLADARLAVDAGADAIGFVFAPSPRQISPAAAEAICRALPPLVLRVGVFVDAALDELCAPLVAGWLDVVQLHGQETRDRVREIPGRVLKRVHVAADDDVATLRARCAAYDAATILLDPGAGSGKTFDWTLARDLGRPVVLAGGLTPDNVAEAIRSARPYAVDVASGVEAAPGRKDPEKIRAFVARAKDAYVHHPA